MGHSRLNPDFQILVKTSSSKDPPPYSPPRRDGASTPTPLSPAFSTSSTVSGSDVGSSPDLPPLPAPTLPQRALDFLRTPFGSDDEDDEDGDGRGFVTASWGSPYPPTTADSHPRRLSFSSDEDSPIHQLTIQTPFLRPPPLLLDDDQDEDDEEGEYDDYDDSDNPEQGQSGGHWDTSITVNDLPRLQTGNWLHELNDTRFEDGSEPTTAVAWSDDRENTPRARESGRLFLPRDPSQPPPILSRSGSTETLKAHNINSEPTADSQTVTMGSDTQETTVTPTTPRKSSVMSFFGFSTPQRPKPQEPPAPSAAAASTPRLKKKIAWKGKNIMIHLPRDDERGQPGKGPIPLNHNEVERMYRSWEELGYSVRGFDLMAQDWLSEGEISQSKGEWPDFGDVNKERAEEKYQVTLPDLNAWKRYEDELREAKLRALGVTLGDDEPTPPLPQAANMSRQSSGGYPNMPFSPPMSATSASGNPAFPFPAQFTSAGPNGGVSSTASPVPFAGPHGRFSGVRQSVSIPSTKSPFQMPPHGWQAGPMGHNRGSPSLMNFNGMRSPNSPFQHEFPKNGSPAFGVHSRHQSMQFPMVPHQTPVNRSHSWLQEVREVDEDVAEVKDLAVKTPETGHRNPHMLQAEIDDAEYHLEEQLRNQLEHEDYSPHQRENGGHQMLPSQFPMPERFSNNTGQPLVLHHPRPHSRGHSLTQNFYRQGEANEGKSAGQFAPITETDSQKADDSIETETNPSNLPTPAQPNFDFTATGFVPPHARNFSTTNPWKDAVSLNSSAVPRAHGPKPSISTLNVQAPEFKFNPTSTFKPGGLAFGGNKGFQPSVPQSATSAPAPSMAPVAQPTHAPQQSVSSKINASAPTFAPGNSDINSNPKFRPNAPTFTPLHSSTNSVSIASPTSSAGNTSGLVFGSVDLNTADIDAIKLPKAAQDEQSAKESPEAVEKPSESHEDEDGPSVDESRVKRVRASSTAEDAEAQLALPSDSAEATPIQMDTPTEELAELADDKSENEDMHHAEVSMLSSAASEPTDKPSAESPSVTSLEQSASNWAPFEFDDGAELASFNEARPFGDGVMFHKSHKKSLSAGAQPFAPGGSNYEAMHDAEPDAEDMADVAISSPSIRAASDIGAARPVSSPSPEPEPRSSRFASPPKELSASGFLSPPRSVSSDDDEHIDVEYVVPDADYEESSKDHWSASKDDEARSVSEEPTAVMQPVANDAILTFDEIDAVMEHMNRHDPTHGVKKSVDPVYEPGADDSPQWLHPDSSRHGSRSPRHVQDLECYGTPSREMLSAAGIENPFVDPPRSVRSFTATLNRPDADATSVAPSDWDRDFSDDYQDKVAHRSQFFDGRVNQLVGGLLASRLGPLEKTLLDIQQAVSRQEPDRRHVSRRSTSLEPRESDADDEDEDEAPRRSVSPQKNRRLDQIRSVVLEALASQPRPEPVAVEQASPIEGSVMLQALEEVKQHLVTSPRAEFNGDDMRTMMEELLEKRMPPPPPPADVDAAAKADELQARLADLEARLFDSQKTVETEVTARRAAQDTSADLERKLHAAETRVEIEIMNRSVFDQRVTDLEEKLRAHDERSEEEVNARRTAEDELANNQRTLRIAIEEEHRLRGIVHDREAKIKDLEVTVGDKAIQLALLEASQTSSCQQQAELNNRANSLEMELKQAKAVLSQLHPELDRARENARRYQHDYAHVVNQNKHLQKILDTLGVQLQETERIRETWRTKYGNMQDELANAHRAIAEDNSRRAKKDEAMRLRQEAFEARLQAESKTRERLEQEMERLESQERNSIRAVKEAKRLEELIGELRTENHQLQQRALKFQVDYQEVRTSASLEIERTKRSMQFELDEANAKLHMAHDEANAKLNMAHEEASAKLNMAHEEREIQVNNLRNEIDNVRLGAETSKMQHDMLLEEAQAIGMQKAEQASIRVEEAQAKHAVEINDLHAHYQGTINELKHEAESNEQEMVARLTLSDSNGKRLEERVQTLGEKLAIAQEAAQAAAQRAKSMSVSDPAQHSAGASKGARGPEKISPQALRESIMVLQEQLMHREQTIEELELQLSQVDPDAPTKITKRDDEITWLRELLAVRHGDLQDVIEALSTPNVNQERVREAVIRLQANLQMEEAERERAMNGGSAINLPNIAQTIREAATPRAQELSTRVAAAWGNWRRGATLAPQPAPALVSSIQSTPAKPTTASQTGFLSGLLTPPATGVRSAGLSANATAQPTAFSTTTPATSRPTSRRLTAHKSTAARRNITPSGSISQGLTASTPAPMPLPPVVSPQQSEEPTTPVRREFHTRPLAPVPAYAQSPVQAYAQAPAQAYAQAPVQAYSQAYSQAQAQPYSQAQTQPYVQAQAQAPASPAPHMMHHSGYDSDAQPGDFDDEDFFEEDE